MSNEEALFYFNFESYGKKLKAVEKERIAVLEEKLIL